MPFKWFVTPGLLQGAFWACITALMSVTNDVITKCVAGRLHSFEIGFFRYFFSAITLIPFMLYVGRDSFKTQNPRLHVWRALLGVAAIGLYTGSLVLMQMAEVISLSFTQPLLLLPLAAFFLKEKVTHRRWLATMVGFCGILVIEKPGSHAFQWMALMPVASAFCFALLDLVAKTMVTKKESTLTMLFYFAVGTTVVGAIPAFFVFKVPTMTELLWLFCLGAGANLIQVFLFQAFRVADASFLAPFRYLELILGTLAGYLFFAEIPPSTIYAGAAIIILSTLYLTYSEERK